VFGATTEKDRRANSVRVLGTFSSGASDHPMTAEDELEQLSGSGHFSTLALSRTSSIERQRRHLVFHSMLTVSGSQWSDLRSGIALVRPPRWQTTLSRLFCLMRYIDRMSQLVHRKAWRYSNPTWNPYCILSEPLSRRLAEYARDAATQGTCMVEFHSLFSENSELSEITAKNSSSNMS